MLHGCRVHAANGEIQIDAPEHLHPRYLFSHHVDEAGSRFVVVLEDEATHAVGTREHRRFESVQGSLSVVGKAVNVNIDRAADGAIDV